MKPLQQLLMPFSALYSLAMSGRNFLFEEGLKSSRKFKVPVIAVGNLTVGGTGKTPHVEYLLRLLNDYRLATLSRGYKRTTKGFLLADATTSAAALGDEPYQYYLDFEKVTVAVCEKRVTGIENLLRLQPPPQVIILDDAFQHRAVQPSLNLLITDYNRPFYKDHVLPAGRLRENRYGASRAHAVVVSKCDPFLTEEKMLQIKSCVHKYAGNEVPVFFSTYKYAAPVAISERKKTEKNIVLLTAIANPAPLAEYLEKAGYNIKKHFRFPDHYAFKKQDLQQIQQFILHHKTPLSIFTTRKDAVKLQEKNLRPLLQQLPVFYIPIQVYFLENQQEFDELIGQHVQRYYS